MSIFGKFIKMFTGSISGTSSMHILDRISPFKGALGDALIHNWLTHDSTNLPGPPIAIQQDEQGAGVGFDMEMWKREGLTETKSIGLIADQGLGKTFTMSLMLLSMLGLDIDGRRCNIDYPSLKHNGGRPETAPLIEDILQCRVISPRTVSFNIYGKALGLTYEEQLRLSISIFQLLNKRDIDLVEEEVLKQVLELNYELDAPDIFTLIQLFKDYMADMEAKKTASSEIFDVTQTFREQYMEAAHRLMLTFKKLNKGEFYNLFAGTGEDLVAALEQRGVSWDMKGIEGPMRSLIEIMLGHIYAAAATPLPGQPEDEPRFPNRLPDVIAKDEAHQDFTNLESLLAFRLRLKTQRAHGVTIVLAFHRLLDLRNAIGSTDSTKIQLAEALVREINVWLIGRQTKEDLAEIRNTFSLPEYVLQDIPHLIRGEFWLIIRGKPPRKIRVVGTPLAISHFVTDQAHHKALSRYLDTLDPEDYYEYLEDTTPEIEEEDNELEPEPQLEEVSSYA